jgi:hypothetical protein
MPVGVGAETLQNIPISPYTVDPASFFAMTSKNILTPRSPAAPGAGLRTSVQLLQSGIVSKLQVTFVGTLVVATAAVTTSDQWPYNLLKGFVLSANGQNNLWDCDGLDLAALRYVRYPAYAERTDVFPDVVGGGGSVGTGTYTVYLTWEVPIAMDDVSLVGSLYAQSAATNLTVTLAQALAADLFSANPANATITGTFHVQETLFAIPIDSKGMIVIPDLSRLHGFNAVEFPVTNTGEARVPLIRSAGQLGRLFVSARGAANNRLSALPNAATTKKLEALRVEYGGNQRPFTWDPASQLLALNNQWYGATAPYDRLVVDLLRENPPRDVILMQGVTELAAVPRIGTGVTLTGASVRLVQETLF